MLIALGTLVALDYFMGLAFSRTWPLLIILFGVLKLLERVVQPVPPSNPGAGPTAGNYPGGSVI
jgi:hypothetical protein